MRRALASAVAATFASVAVVVLPPATPAAAVDSGTFTVLTYNIAGLPEFLSSAATDRESATTAIGQRLGPYDVINVQEDFNYHAYLYAADNHPYRTPTSGGVPFGSGLNTLSNYPYDEDDFERVTWSTCSSNSGDCLTPKGFTFARARLAEGVYVDVYNLHADAGGDSGDLSARAANFAQLSSFIFSHSAGNAVVVMGDTNTRYTRTTDGTTIRDFASANGLTDVWVEVVRGGNPPAEGSDALVCDSTNPTNDCEIVDKIWYRGSKFVTLNATAYNNDHVDFLEDGTGLPLSDHFPISARFSWATNPAYQFSDQFGGPHGDYFNDIDRVAWGAQATTISLRAGERVDQVGVTLADGTTMSHGGTGGSYSSLTLASTEYVTSAYLCRAKHDDRTRIFYARFTTNLGRTLAGGTTTSDCVARTAPAGWQITGFHGRSGTEIDKLGFIYTPNDVMLVNRATGKMPGPERLVNRRQCERPALDLPRRSQPTLADGAARRAQLRHHRRDQHPAVHLVEQPLPTLNRCYGALLTISGAVEGKAMDLSTGRRGFLVGMGLIGADAVLGDHSAATAASRRGSREPRAGLCVVGR